MDGKEEEAAAQAFLIWLVGWLLQFLFGWLVWLVVAFKASHKRICGMEGKERRGELRQFLFITTAQTVSTHNDIANAPPLFCNTIRSSTTIGKKHPSALTKNCLSPRALAENNMSLQNWNVQRKRRVSVLNHVLPFAGQCTCSILYHIVSKYYSMEFFHKGLRSRAEWKISTW